jgi:glycosyltransferase involved in cell wall biosynthesis
MNEVSLIISVYNKIHELDLLLAALEVQSCKDFEVIIADDGSVKTMNEFIHNFSKVSPFPLSFVTHEDIGFRKNVILNKAIVKSTAHYLIFIDGDCIPHIDFIKHHIDNKRYNTVLCGRRVNLSKKLSGEITKTGLLRKELQKVKFKHFIDSFINKSERSTYVERGIVLENKLLRKIFNDTEPHIVGCNFSLHKELIEKINGFDENYSGPGIGEDSDIEFRLKLINANFISLKNLAVLFHLFHNNTLEERNNFDYFENVKSKGEAICRNGIIKLNNI